MPENFDVPGTFDERLTAGAARLEQEAAVRSPAGVRARGDQRRRRHTTTLAVAPVLVLAIAGAAGLTLRPSGGARHNVSGPPPASSTVWTSTGGTTPSTSAVAAPTATLDLGRHTMTVRDAQGTVVKTLPITAGIPTHPTKTGTFTVVGKKLSERLTSVDGNSYNASVSYYIDFGPQAPAIYAAPWQQPNVGKTNATHGDIELFIGDAVWLYDHLTVGDTIQIESGTGS
ncbi:lipoprotein-anchoring transpeptidase ErfK/SrfK [Catenulispora sp. GAS73]|uniref:L,D-transpeptidase n=1 Tax=Catenulispora sp. GAS73 TaxID=3156269 RepID=UPI003519D41F